MRAPALDEELELDECEDDGLEELNATGRLTLAEIAQAALDAELEENDFDWQTVSKMREPAPEPTEPAPAQPSEPSEPAPEPEQPEPAPPAPQSARWSRHIFRYNQSLQRFGAASRNAG